MNIFLTGGTGFLGEYLLAELLRSGHEVWSLFRNEARKMDTVRFLSKLGLPRCGSQLHWVEGDVLQVDRKWGGWLQESPAMSAIDTIVHSAASTRLHLNEQGDPVRTNVGASQALKRLAELHPATVHLVSTAYTCGMGNGSSVLEVRHPKGRFVTVYEESKWDAEELWHGQATILRPSIIVGDSVSGRCTSFSGCYLFFQAVDMFWRLVGNEAGENATRFDFPLEGESTVNIVPVDYVADAAVRVMEDSAMHGRIYHLTHPNPPTYSEIMEILLERYGRGDVRFTGNEKEELTPTTPFEKMWMQQMKTVKRYMGHAPVFDRTNADTIKAQRPVADMDAAFMNKLIDYAVARDWGQ